MQNRRINPLGVVRGKLDILINIKKIYIRVLSICVLLGWISTTLFPTSIFILFSSSSSPFFSNGLCAIMVYMSVLFLGRDGRGCIRSSVFSSSHYIHTDTSLLFPSLLFASSITVECVCVIHRRVILLPTTSHLLLFDWRRKKNNHLFCVLLDVCQFFIYYSFFINKLFLYFLFTSTIALGLVYFVCV